MDSTAILSQKFCSSEIVLSGMFPDRHSRWEFPARKPPNPRTMLSFDNPRRSARSDDCDEFWVKTFDEFWDHLLQLVNYASIQAQRSHLNATCEMIHLVESSSFIRWQATDAAKKNRVFVTAIVFEGKAKEREREWARKSDIIGEDCKDF